MVKRMRFGYTTGSCAAAGTKAALLACFGKHVTCVDIVSPQGELIAVPVQSVCKTDKGARAVIVKDAGDDPDITNGAEIVIDVAIAENAEIEVCGGKGVGVVTKPGLSVPVGRPAINPGPMTMILAAAREVLGERRGCRITVSIPNGEALATRTLNPTLGIEGGISIIGTTGIVRPMSEEAFKASLKPQIAVAKALGYRTLVFVPGKIGERAAVERFGLPAESVVQTSNFIGYMLEAAVDEGINRILLFGHLGKLAKVAAGNFHTHNRVSDARMETIAAYAAVSGAARETVRALLSCTTSEAAMTILSENGLTELYSTLAERASIRAVRYVFGALEIGTVLVSLQGALLGMDNAAKNIGGGLSWNIKSS